MIIRIVTTRGTKSDTFGGPYCTYVHKYHRPKGY